MIADAPPAVEVVVVRPPNLPPNPADAAFSIIRLDEDALSVAARLDESLALVPGFQLFRRTSSLGANPTTQGVSLRAIAGSGASRALVTLDGVPQNDPFGGWVAWTSLPAEIIGGAMIVRGAGAGPYGAGALTGVVALAGRDVEPGDWTWDGLGASRGEARSASTLALPAGGGVLFLAADAEHSDGWIPVREGRGAADTRLTLDDRSASAAWLVDLGAANGEVRASAYQENRGSGLAGAVSSERGAILSATIAQSPTPAAMGWRAQLWAHVSDLENTSVSVAPDRSSTSLADDQYDTPGVGYGANVEARWLYGWGVLELGSDARGAAGDDHETFHPVDGVLTGNRVAGGQTLTGGAYAEATREAGRWLLVAGVRTDGWEEFDGHRIETIIATGQTSLDLRPPARGGILPSARLAARYDIADGAFLRAAAYSSFRAPTLDELYRPFRVGNDVTNANADLVPERLVGIEAGGGAKLGPVRLEGAVFYNRLGEAVVNATIAMGPFTDPLAGFIPAGGVLFQRRNVTAIDAYGVESEARAELSPNLSSVVALDWTDARVDGGSAAPELTGLRPAETPRLAVTGSLDWRVLSRLGVIAELRYQSARFDDDQNTRRLAPATTVDVEVDWRISSGGTFFIAAQNLFNVAVATGQTATGVTSYGPPRSIGVGFRLRGGPAARQSASR